MVMDKPDCRACEMGIAHIQYRDSSGNIRQWSVGVLMGVDNEYTLREHLKKYCPTAEFISCEFE